MTFVAASEAVFRNRQLWHSTEVFVGRMNSFLWHCLHLKGVWWFSESFFEVVPYFPLQKILVSISVSNFGVKITVSKNYGVKSSLMI